MISLPVEVWVEIARFAWMDEIHAHSVSHTTLQLISVCRMFHQIGTRLLYRQIDVGYNYSKVSQFLSMVPRNEVAASSVCRLRLCVGLPTRALHGFQSMFSAALTELPKLKSLSLVINVYKHPRAPGSHTITDIYESIFSAPSRFPFRLQVFATSAFRVNSLSAFITSQTDLRLLECYNNSPASDKWTTIPPSVISLTCSDLHNWGAAAVGWKLYFQEAESLRFLTFGVPSYEEYYEDGEALSRDLSLLKDVPFMKQIQGLLLSVEWVEIEICLSPFLPYVPSLQYLSLSLPRGEGRDTIAELTPMLRRIPNLKVFALALAWTWEDVERLKQLGKELPSRPYMLVKVLDTDQDEDSVPTHVRIYESSKGNWDHQILPLSAFNPFPPPGVFDVDVDWTNPTEVFYALWYDW